MKRFIIGFWIVLFIILLYFVPVAIYRTSYDLFTNILVPIFIYISIYLAGKLSSHLYSKNLFYFTKYFGSLFFIICTLAIAEWDKIYTMFPLFVSISILCNWNIKEEKNPVQKNNEEESLETKSNNYISYLINFITLLIVYVIASLCYFSMEISEGVWIEIIITGIALGAIFWIGYLFYNHLIKDTKTTRIIKILMIVGLLYWIYYFCSTIKEMPFHLLISVVIGAFISLTIQNLILTKKK